MENAGEIPLSRTLPLLITIKTRTLQLTALAFVICAGTLTQAADTTNSLVWQSDRDLVSANIHNEPLWPLLEDIAHQTGWHIFVEPSAKRDTSVGFRDLPPGEALHKLLGPLNYAIVPQTNGPQQLYVFTTRMENATRRVYVAPPKVAAMKHVPNQIMVRLKPGADIDAIAKARGAKVVGRNDKLGIYLLQFSDSSTTDSALAGLKNDPNISSLDYNYIFDSPPTPQPLQNAPSGTGAFSLTLNPNVSTDPSHPIVGLIDTGVQSLGSQLDPFLLKSINVTGDTSYLDSSSPTHGTAMAETILRAVSQQGGSTSVQILPVNVYDNGETTSSWNVALGIQAAVDGGATVLNMSLAGPTDSAVLDDIVKQALAKGIVIFAAAGNQPVDTPNYPAAISGVNAVTALGSPGQLASYANYGSFIDMALPGNSLVIEGNQAWIVQGTSPATAYASGVAAGTKAATGLSWTQIENAMVQKFTVPQK